jgi:hypothetical protein
MNMPTKAEKEIYARLARLGCILCKQRGVETSDSPTEMHHIRRFGGLRKNAPVIPLCAYHHRLGNSAVHQLGHKGFAKYWGFSEEDLLEKTEELLNV